MAKTEIQQILCPPIVILIRSVHGVLNPSFTFNEKEYQYEHFGKMSICDDRGVMYDFPVTIIYPAQFVMMDRKSFLTPEDFNSHSVIEHKKEAINRLIHELKNI